MACRQYVVPLLFGASCNVCGHSESEHLARKLAQTTLKASSAHARATSVSPATVRQGTPRVEVPPVETVCDNVGCNGPRRPHSNFCRRSCEPSGQLFRGLKTHRQPALLAEPPRFKCCRDGCGNPVVLDSQGDYYDYCSQECLAMAAKSALKQTYGQTTKRRAAEHSGFATSAAATATTSLEITPTRNADGSTTLKITLPSPSTGSQQAAKPTKRKHGGKHDEKQADMYAKAAEAAALLGNTATAESLFLTAAGLYRQIDAAPESGASTVRSDTSLGLYGSPASTPRRGMGATHNPARDSLSLTAASAALSGNDAQLLMAAHWDGPLALRAVALIRAHTNGRPEIVAEAFKCCLAHVGFRGDLDACFAAFDRRRRRTWLTTEDFVVGLAALDVSTPHSGPWLDVRLGYIFRYYAAGRLLVPHSVLVTMLEDMARAAATTLNSEAAAVLARQLNPAKAALAEADLAAIAVRHPAAMHGAARLFRCAIRSSLQAGGEA